MIAKIRLSVLPQPLSALYLECLTSQAVCLLNSGFLLPIAKGRQLRGRCEPAVNIVNRKRIWEWQAV